MIIQYTTDERHTKCLVECQITNTATGGLKIHNYTHNQNHRRIWWGTFYKGQNPRSKGKIQKKRGNSWETNFFFCVQPPYPRQRDTDKPMTRTCKLFQWNIVCYCYTNILHKTFFLFETPWCVALELHCTALYFHKHHTSGNLLWLWHFSLEECRVED